jgi:pimeloyl-ACP methyl ester carboxylesterase
VEAKPPGDAPLCLLLHGFPEFWYAWRHQIPVLRDAGDRVVAPDLRGYNLSGKPPGVASYRLEVLCADVEQLIAELGHNDAVLIGHDWGGLIAWHYAMRRPQTIRRLVVMNCPHPGHQLAMMASPRQLRKSWYMLFFQLPWLPERWAKRSGFSALRRVFRYDPQRRDAFSDEDIDRYVAAFSAGGMKYPMHYYRALLRRNPFDAHKQLRPIDVPTQVIWGAADSALGLEYAEPPAKWVWDLRMDVIDDASHWVHADRPEKVNALLLDFLGARN